MSGGNLFHLKFMITRILISVKQHPTFFLMVGDTAVSGYFPVLKKGCALEPRKSVLC